MVRRNFVREFMELILETVLTALVICVFGLMVIFFA